ncbi:nuclear factor NF-kappa-B p110 subunit, partial [Frankliniella occidentalis]|uniref:Nuclear factor NF-kappa-B p110 subunit n=1 Tax=Frankliniella occidentalis TaxID=133901 RepID=A0A9C6TN35_FRAOC
MSTSEATQFYNNFSIEELYAPQAQTTQAWDQSSCNGATMFPTPSPSPTSHQTSPFSSSYSEEGEMAYSEGEVKLRIIEQPVPMFRFRYRSEMNGAHGSLLGQSENPKRKTYPTVELVNYDGEAIIRCSLYTATPPHIPHMHQLIAKPSNNREILDHEVTVSDRNGYRAEFRGLGIVHMAKKNLTKELMRKKEKDLIEKLKRQKNLPHFGDERQQIALKEMLPQLEAAAKRDAETMDANKLRLCFEAFERGPNGEMRELCERVFSDTIQNMKSAETGGLKICRIDKCAGSCNGGDEIYILVEKVCKKNVKIRFFEDDEHGQEVWSDEGLFSENDVHHQYAIVFRTPPYKRTDIEKDVSVKVELVRPKDNARSDPVPFRYKPARRYGQKRPCPSFSSLESSSSFEAPKRSKAPVMISGDDPMISGEKAISWNLSSETLNDVMKDLSSEVHIDEDFANFILSSNLSSYSQALNESKDRGGCRVEEDQNMLLLQSEHCDFSPNMSSPGCLETFGDLSIERNSDWQTDGPGSKQNKEKHVDVVVEGVSSKNHLVKKTASSSEDEAVKVTSNLAKNAYDKLLKLMKSRHPSRLQDMKNIIRAEDQEFGPLHAAVIHGQLKELSDLLSLVIKSNQLKLINTSNRRRQTPLMVAVEENRVDCLKLLCMARADINQADYEENTAFHIAVKNKNSECLQVLLSAKKSQDSSCKIDLNRRNEYGETALHIAVMKKDMKCVTQLVAAGADLNVKTGTSGSTPLHIAVETNSSEIVRLLLSQENINVNEVNFSIKTPADLIKPSQKTITSLFMKVILF